MVKSQVKATVAPKKQGNQWGKPELVDVTGKIMAQPFIRFT